MKILYSRGTSTFLAEFGRRKHFVSIGKNERCEQIDDYLAQELLQSGFWLISKDISSDVERGIFLSIIAHQEKVTCFPRVNMERT